MTELPTTGFAGHRGLGWSLLARWLIPFVMTTAYVILAVTSETDRTGQAWMAVGLAFVFVLWWLFVILTEHAAMARAVAVGDAERLAELADLQLARRRRVPARARYLVYRALAHDMRGDWVAALATLDDARLDAVAERWRALAACVRVHALVETRDVTQARAILDRDLLPVVATLDRRLHVDVILFATVVHAAVVRAEGNPADAAPLLARVIDDVRADAWTRALAKTYS